MGLDIGSLSDKEYSYSYSGIHYIRYMAYCSIGGEDGYLDWHKNYYGEWGATEPVEITGKYVEVQERFPNLYVHSDCDGKYTLDGHVEEDNGKNGLQTGNSRELLKELEYIKAELPKKHDKEVTDRDWYVFNMLYELVKDVVENHDGVIEFH